MLASSDKMVSGRKLSYSLRDSCRAALSLARLITFENVGMSTAARIAMTAITITSSVIVKPRFAFLVCILVFIVFFTSSNFFIVFVLYFAPRRAGRVVSALCRLKERQFLCLRNCDKISVCIIGAKRNRGIST